MIVYISLPNNVTLNSKNCIKIKDIATICVCNGNENKVNEIKVLDINKNEDKLYHISIIDVVKKIKEYHEDVEVINLGKQDMVVEYMQQPKKENKLFEYAKIVLVCLILFFGGATTIIAFHIETQLIDVLKNVYIAFTGEEVKNMNMLSIPYTLGIGIGIVTFFNHIGNKKITNDPTPIEMELTQFETNIIETIVDKLNKGNDKQC